MERAYVGWNTKLIMNPSNLIAKSSTINILIVRWIKYVAHNFSKEIVYYFRSMWNI